MLFYETTSTVPVNDENEVPHVPMTRWSYEDALTHLAASTKQRLLVYSVSTPEHMEHIEKILGSCAHFKDVSFANGPSPMNAQISFGKEKTMEKENRNISVSFQKEFGENESRIYIDVESNGFRIDCQILDPEVIAYSHLLDYLKEVSNHNKMVCITLDDVAFKDLFVELGWQYEDYMEENLRNGAASSVRLLNDSNVYCLEKWDQVDSIMENAHEEADSNSGLSDL